MRTTIEIKNEHRARLLNLAARRGDNGFSKIIEEAIEKYLKALEADEDKSRRALELSGSLSAAAAERLKAEVGRIRKSWR